MVISCAEVTVEATATSIPDDGQSPTPNVIQTELDQSSNIELGNIATRRNVPSSSPTSSRGVNDTFLRRWTLLAALETLGRTWPHDGCVLLLTKSLCVKRGALVQLSEASTLRCVGEHTTIPVPKVHCAFVHKDRTYILMDRINGKVLICGWRMRSAESQGKILAQLKEMVDQLRSLPPPSPCISNVDGPFDTIHDFHCHLCNGVEAHPRNRPDINRMIALQDRPRLMPVFMHGDLSSFNILAHSDNIVGIIDWETSGWYPSYWEYSMAWYVNPWNVFWREEVSKFLDATPEEGNMEQIRLTYFGNV